MAISTVTNRVAYQGDGSSAVFNFGFEIQAQTDLAVFTYNSSATTNGIILAKVLNTDYTFSGTLNNQNVYPNGGNIIFNSTPNVQTQIVIFRSTVVTNDFFVPQNGTIPSTSLNKTLDRLTLLEQRSQDLNTRSVRLPDGFPRTFDTSLPSNVGQSAGKRLIVNSSATGWTFDETLGQYIQNTLIYATTNSSIVSLPGAAAGLILTSNGSSAPSWGTVVFGSTAITGVIPQLNGGTGTGSTFTQGRVIFAGSGATFNESANFFWDDTNKILGVGPNANQTTFTISQLPFMGGITSGASSSIVGVASFIAYKHADTADLGPRTYYLRSRGSNLSPVLVQSGDTLASFDAAGFDGSSYIVGGRINFEVDGTAAQTNMPGRIVFQTVNGSGNTSIEALRLDSQRRAQFNGDIRIGSSNLNTNAGLWTNASSVIQCSGPLPIAMGGTGTPGGFVQFGVLYASSTTQLSVIPSATAGLVLTANGSSAPTFQAVAATPVAAKRITVTSSVVATDNTAILSGSSYQLTLFDAAANEGAEIDLIHDGSSFVQSYQLITRSSQLIGSIASGAYTLQSRGEVLGLKAFNGNFVIKRRQANTALLNLSSSWLVYTNTGLGTLAAANIASKRNGDMLEVQAVITTGTVSGSSASIIFQSGLVIDSSKMSVGTAGFSCGEYVLYTSGASRGIYSTPDAGKVFYDGALTDRVFFASNTGTNAFVKGTGTGIFANSLNISFSFKVPIVGWQP